MFACVSKCVCVCLHVYLNVYVCVCERERESMGKYSSERVQVKQNFATGHIIHSHPDKVCYKVYVLNPLPQVRGSCDVHSF